MSRRRNTVRKMAEWLNKEYSTLDPKERRRKVRKVLGDNKSARSFVKRLMPESYDDIYGQPKAGASSNSVSLHTEPLHAKSR